MKKLLKSIALVFVVVFGLCAFSACGEKDPEPPTPTKLTNNQVKTVLDNFCDKFFTNIGDGEDLDILPDQDTAITSNYSGLGLSDSAFFTLDEEKLTINIQESLQMVAIIAALKDENETIGKAFSITGTQYNLYVESANTEKIVIQSLTKMPAAVTDTETNTSNYCSIIELYLNSDSTNVSQMVMTTEDGTYYSLSFDGDLKITHFTCIDSESVDLQNKKVTSILEFNLLAKKGYFQTNTPQEGGYEPKSIISEATRKAVYTAVYNINPTTIEATVSANFEGKELKALELGM